MKYKYIYKMNSFLVSLCVQTQHTHLSSGITNAELQNILHRNFCMFRAVYQKDKRVVFIRIQVP